jgi:hypothetical protein
MTVDKYDLALKKLRDASFNAITEDSLLIKLKDEPGALAKIVNRFKDANINIRSFHIISRDGQNSRSSRGYRLRIVPGASWKAPLERRDSIFP